MQVRRVARRGWQVSAGWLLMAGVLALAGGLARAATPAGGPVFGPYKHLNMGVDPAKPVARVLRDGVPLPLINTQAAKFAPGMQVLTLAFASGECGAEHWGALDGQQVADANIGALQRAGLRYVISTGGEGGVFTCASAAGMQAFITRYDSPALLGLDFDIEASQTEAQIDALVHAIAQALAQRPRLRLSFTLATLAASDGSGHGLNAHGQQVMQALRNNGLDKRAIINLMVMNYGPATGGNCVVRAGRCDMAASARQAVDNLHRRHAVPYGRIAVTAMLGVNDVTDNVFTPDDAYRLARYARQRGLAGLHYWSLDRDQPCAQGATAVSPTCSSLNQAPAQAFARAFARGLR